MKCAKNIDPVTAQGLAVMLTPYFPGITVEKLVNALLNYETGENKPEVVERPYTRKEAAELLGMSAATLDRLVKDGILKKIVRPGHEGKRGGYMRVSAASIREFLNGTTATAANMEV